MSGRGRAAARRAGGRARGRRAGSGQPRHQDSARPRRLAAPPRYWRPRSRAISLRHHRLGSAGTAAPTTPRQREPGGRGREAAFWSPAESEHLQHLPLLRLRHRRRVLKARRLLPLPLIPPPPLLHQLHPGNSAVAAFGKARQFPPHPPPTHPSRLENAAFGKPRLAPALLFL